MPPGQVKGTGNVTESFRYFYHPDHLGSTSYVTDASGEVFQHLEYFAFGQTFVEEHSNTDRTPFLFNGKELDDETGLYYYGARYYEPGTSVWLSLDPMADDYPGWSPYNYCLNNPVVNFDPDGRSTHTDSDGNVVAVYDDKDLGIFKHSDLSGWNKTDVLGKTGDGVALMGHTLMWNSFTTRGSDNSPAGKINFGSYEAQRWVYSFEDEMTDMIAVNDWDKRMTYAANAGNGDKYDYKTSGLKEGATDAERRAHSYRGSQISEGIYVSGRDVGNFAAGAAARITNQDKMDFMLTAGGFQLSGNSKMEIAFRTSHWQGEARKAGWPAWGEAPGSNFFQRLGFENVKTMEGMKQNEVRIWGQKLK